MFWVMAVLGVVWAAVAIGAAAQHPVRVAAGQRGGARLHRRGPGHRGVGEPLRQRRLALAAHQPEPVDRRRRLLRLGLHVLGLHVLAAPVPLHLLRPERSRPSARSRSRRGRPASSARWSAASSSTGSTAARSSIRSRFTIMGCALLLSGASLIPVVPRPDADGRADLHLARRRLRLRHRRHLVGRLDRRGARSARQRRRVRRRRVRARRHRRALRDGLHRRRRTGTFTSGFVMMSALAVDRRAADAVRHPRAGAPRDPEPVGRRGLTGQPRSASLRRSTRPLALVAAQPDGALQLRRAPRRCGRGGSAARRGRSAAGASRQRPGGHQLVHDRQRRRRPLRPWTPRRPG